MLQLHNARPHVARIRKQFLEAKKKPQTSLFLRNQRTRPLGMIGMLRINVHVSPFQLLPEEWTNIPQAIIVNLIKLTSTENHVRQMVDIPDMRLVFRPPPRPSLDHPDTLILHILECPFIVGSLRLTSCGLICMLICHRSEVYGLSRQRRSAH